MNVVLTLTPADMTDLHERLDRIEKRLANVEMQPAKDLLTRDELAAFIGKSPRTIDRWTAAGKLKPEEIGGTRMYRRPT